MRVQNIRCDYRDVFVSCKAVSCSFALFALKSRAVPISPIDRTTDVVSVEHNGTCTLERKPLFSLFSLCPAERCVLNGSEWDVPTNVLACCVSTFRMIAPFSVLGYGVDTRIS